MNFFGVSSLIIAIVTGLMATVMFFRKSGITNLWGLFATSVFLWGLGGFFISISLDKNKAILLWHIAYIGVIFIPVFLNHFILNFLKLRNKFYKFQKILVYIIGILFLVSNFFNGLFINETRFVFSQFYYISPPALLYTPFVVFFFIVILYNIFLLQMASQKAVGLNLKRIRYIIVGLIVGFAGGSFSFLPVYKIDIYPFFNSTIAVSTVIIGYAIARYRFLDIRLVILRTISFGFIILLITGVFAALSVLFGSRLEAILGFRSDILVGLIVAILVTLTYQPVKNLTERVTNRFLYKKSYDPDVLLAEINEVTSSILDLKNLLASIAGTLSDAFHFEKFGVALLDKKNQLTIAHQVGFKPGVAEGLSSFPDVVKILYQEVKQTPGIMVIDEMKTRFENGEYQPASPALLQALYEADIALVTPLYVQEQLIGVITLGNKKSGDPYNNADLNVLKIIAGQAGIAIENARLYDELKDFNIKLEDEVTRKTAQLRKANAELRQLDEAKSEFISIASHQLRTPLTVIKGFISMIQEGSFGSVPAPIQEHLNKVYLSNERLIRLVEDLLNISRIESGKQEYNFSEVHLDQLAQTVTENLKKIAKDKDLKLFYHAAAKPLPTVTADADKIYEVMMNFVDNAIKYTEKGEINVYLAAEPKNMVTFCVKDTGKGLAPEIQGALFKKFSRGKDSFRMHTEGLGLGLYVAKLLMDRHGGKIWAESEGDNKGSKFCFSLPMKISQDKK